MLERLRRRGTSTRTTSTTIISVPALSQEHRHQTDTTVASLLAHGVLCDDEIDIEQVYEHVRLNLPEVDEPVGFHEVIASFAESPDPLTNLAFAPQWSELTPADVEEFTEAVCWLAAINTSACAHLVPGASPGSTKVEIRFDLEPGTTVGVETVVPPKGLPEDLLGQLADLLDERLAPRRIVTTPSDGRWVITALDPDTMSAVNEATNAAFEPVGDRNI